MTLAQAVEQPWYSNGAWLVTIALVLLWLLYVIGKIRRGRKK
jgi:hypothetical protein